MGLLLMCSTVVLGAAPVERLSAQPNTSDVVYVAAVLVIGFDPPGEPVAVEYDETASPNPISNNKCQAFDQCPVVRLINDQGNYVGCTAACTGSCEFCSASVCGAQLCVRSHGSTCDLSTTSVDCGKKGAGACAGPLGGGPPDNRGCTCAPPATYPGSTCKVFQCLAEQ